VPTGTLARLAQRIGKVFASASTWYRLVREHRWRRPRQRVHPDAPKVGIRAARPNEIWHVDTSVVRLLDGSRVFLHAVIDNFSRRILAWKVAQAFNPVATVEILLTAAKGLVDGKPMLLVDGGVENFNEAVDKLIGSGLLTRVLAQTEITFSNSMIESWWRVLKHQWLFLNTLDSVQTVEKLVAFYVEEHIRAFRIRRSAGKRRTRCTLVRAKTFPSHWRPHDGLPARREQRPIGSGPAAPASW